MALKCPQCGSGVLSGGTNRFTCLVCGANSKYAEPTDQGRIPNPDGPAHYYGDDGVKYHGDPDPDTKR